MLLFTDDQRFQLLANGAAAASGERRDAFPVVKLYTPDFRAVWLLTELDPHDRDTAYGLCDAGLGTPELGTISIAYLESMKGPMGYPVMLDSNFVAKSPLSVYVRRALVDGSVTD